MTRILQGRRPPPAMHKVFPGFMERYGMQPYTDPTAPAVFFGCYSLAQLRQAAAHKGLLVMAWLGSDVMGFGARPLWKRPNIRHVAIGPFIERDLKKLGLKYRRVNLLGSPLLERLITKPLGDAVYCYCPKAKDQFFGGKTLRKVIAALPGVRFIVARDHKAFPQDDMPGIYEQCFIGLRLTKHDGGAETVIEMGLMGRRCIYNGDTPNAIPWENADGIVEIILNEQKKSGRRQIAVAKRVREHCEFGTEWLEGWE